MDERAERRVPEHVGNVGTIRKKTPGAPGCSWQSPAVGGGIEPLIAETSVQSTQSSLTCAW